LKIHRYFLRRIYSPTNVVFSYISLTAIFAEVIENEFIIERHLCDPCQKAVIWAVRHENSQTITDREKKLQSIDCSFGLYKALWVGLFANAYVRPTRCPLCDSRASCYSAQRLDLFVQCVRLKRLSVGFRTHSKSLQFRFIHSTGTGLAHSLSSFWIS